MLAICSLLDMSRTGCNDNAVSPCVAKDAPMSRSLSSQDAMRRDTGHDRLRHPDRQPTLVFQESFNFIQRIQAAAAADRNLPAIDHGTLASAALALVADMPEAPQLVIDRALQLIIQRRQASRSN
jgi:hypothetical protein